MTSRGEVWALLVANEGKWLTRADIEQVGGAESMRRLREIRGAAWDAGYRYEDRKTIGNLLEYRLVRIPSSRRVTWACTKCGSETSGDLQPSTDARDRYRLGPCGVCRTKQAVFKKE